MSVASAEQAGATAMSGEASRPAPRSRDADALRVTAMALVVLLHAAAPAVATVTLPDARWHLANVIDSITRPAVPLFLMLSGALALRESAAADPVRFLKRRAPGFWIPAIAWAIAFTAWDAWRDHKTWRAGNALLGVLRGDAHYHLWYVWVAGGLLFAYPVLARWWTAARERERPYALVTWVVLSVVAPWAGRLWMGGAPRLQLFVIGGYAGLPLLGAWLASREWRGREFRLVQLAGIAGLVLTIGGTAVLRHQAMARATPTTTPATARVTASSPSVANAAQKSTSPAKIKPPRFDDRYYGYLTPNVVAMAIAWWVTILPLGVRASASQGGRGDGRLLAWIADASYPVYLMHPLVLEGAVRAFPARASALADPRLAPVVALAAISLSLALIAVGSRIPVLRAVMPVADRGSSRGPRR